MMNTTINDNIQLDEQWHEVDRALSDLELTIRERKRAHEAKLTFYTNLFRPKLHYKHIMASFRYEHMLEVSRPYTPSGSELALYYTWYRKRYHYLKAISPLV